MPNESVLEQPVSKHLDPEKRAQDLLNAVWDSSLPVDPIYIAKVLGLKVYTAQLDPGVSGMLEKRAGYADPEITLNADDSRNRQRFTCAHELGHYDARTAADDDGDWTYVDLRDPLSSTGTRGDEVYANQFGAALLMPAGRVRELWEQHHSVSALAYKFGVSADAMSYRLENLGLR